jgi:hypothetical protein
MKSLKVLFASKEDMVCSSFNAFSWLGDFKVRGIR